MSISDSHALCVCVGLLLQFQFLCANNVCSDVPCSATDDILTRNTTQSSTTNTPPTLTLLLPPSTLGEAEVVGYARVYRIPFGPTNPTLALAPCPAATNIDSCAATAIDAQQGDLTTSIIFADVSPCKLYPTISTGCYRCGATSVLAGTCLPGEYDFEYTVTDKQGAVSAARVRLVVEQLLSSVQPVTVDSGAASLPDAEGQGEAYVANSTLALQLARLVLPSIFASVTADSIRAASVESARAVAIARPTTMPGEGPILALALSLRFTMGVASFTSEGLPNVSRFTATLSSVNDGDELYGPGRRLMVAPAAPAHNNTALPALPHVSPRSRLRRSAMAAEAKLEIVQSLKTLVSMAGRRAAPVITPVAPTPRQPHRAPARILQQACLPSTVDLTPQMFAPSINPLILSLGKPAPLECDTRTINEEDLLVGSLVELVASVSRWQLNFTTWADSVINTALAATMGEDTHESITQQEVCVCMCVCVFQWHCQVWVVRGGSYGHCGTHDRHAGLALAGPAHPIYPILGYNTTPLFTCLPLPALPCPQVLLLVSQARRATSHFQSHQALLQSTAQALFTAFNMTKVSALDAFFSSLDTTTDTEFSLTALLAELSKSDTSLNTITTMAVLEGLGLVDAPASNTDTDAYVRCLYERSAEPVYRWNVSVYGVNEYTPYGPSAGIEPPATPSPATPSIPSRRRRLLAEVATRTPYLAGWLERWLGYSVYSDPVEMRSGDGVKGPWGNPADAWRRLEVGGTKANILMAGVLLHQKRRDSTVGESDGSCDSIFWGLSSRCEGSIRRTLVGQTGTSGHMVSVGTDPVFNTRSQLYNSLATASAFYNVTPEANEVNSVSGAPHGFFMERMPHYSDGFPVFFDARLPNARAKEALLYLRDGSYLNSNNTATMSTEFVVYNAELKSFAHMALDFKWNDAGSVVMTSDVRGIPATAYTGRIQDFDMAKFIPDVLLVLVTVWYVPLTFIDILIQVRHSTGVTSW